MIAKQNRPGRPRVAGRCASPVWAAALLAIIPSPALADHEAGPGTALWLGVAAGNAGMGGLAWLTVRRSPQTGAIVTLGLLAVAGLAAWMILDEEYMWDSVNAPAWRSFRYVVLAWPVAVLLAGATGWLRRRRQP